MPIEGWVCIALSLLIALAGYEIPRWEWRKLARNTPSAKGERVFTLNDEGINVTFPMGKAQYEWSIRALSRDGRLVRIVRIPSPNRVVDSKKSNVA